MSKATPIRSIKDLSDIIRQHRRQRKLTQKTLANYAGVETKQISRLENGAIEPKLSTILAVLTALDLELNAADLHAQRITIQDIFS